MFRQTHIRPRSPNPRPKKSAVISSTGLQLSNQEVVHHSEHQLLVLMLEVRQLQVARDGQKRWLAPFLLNVWEPDILAGKWAICEGLTATKIGLKDAKGPLASLI